MSPEETQAEALARWLEQPPGTPPPEDVDADVLEAMYALRPELAPAPALTVEDILGSVTSGPLADDAARGIVLDAADGRAQDGARNDVGAAAPVPEAANRPPSRMGWLIGGGVAAALAAAMVLVAIVPLAMSPSQAPVSDVAMLDLEEAAPTGQPAPSAPLAKSESVEGADAPRAARPGAREMRQDIPLGTVAREENKEKSLFDDAVAQAEPEPEPPPPAATAGGSSSGIVSPPEELAEGEADAVADLSDADMDAPADDFAYELEEDMEEQPVAGASATTRTVSPTPVADVGADEAESLDSVQSLGSGRALRTSVSEERSDALASLSRQAAPRGPLSEPALSAKAFLDQGNARDAITATEAALARTDLDASARADLLWVQGRAHQVLGNERRARRAFEDAVRLRGE